MSYSQLHSHNDAPIGLAYNIRLVYIQPYAYKMVVVLHVYVAEFVCALL